MQILYAREEDEAAGGYSKDTAAARERALRELPALEYPATKSTVYPALGWAEQRKKLLHRSGTVPTQGLALE